MTKELSELITADGTDGGVIASVTVGAGELYYVDRVLGQVISDGSGNTHQGKIRVKRKNGTYTDISNKAESKPSGAGGNSNFDSVAGTYLYPDDSVEIVETNDNDSTGTDSLYFLAGVRQIK